MLVNKLFFPPRKLFFLQLLLELITKITQINNAFVELASLEGDCRAYSVPAYCP